MQSMSRESLKTGIHALHAASAPAPPMLAGSLNGRHRPDRVSPATPNSARGTRGVMERRAWRPGVLECWVPRTPDPPAPITPLLHHSAHRAAESQGLHGATLSGVGGNVH